MKRFLWYCSIVASEVFSFPSLIFCLICSPFSRAENDSREDVELTIQQLIDCYQECSYERVTVVTNGNDNHKYVYEVQSPNYVGWIEHDGHQTTVSPKGEVLT